MRPSAMATSMSSCTSAVHTFTSRAPVITVSAGVRPWATAARVCVHSQSGFLQKWFSMGASFSAR